MARSRRQRGRGVGGCRGAHRGRRRRPARRLRLPRARRRGRAFSRDAIPKIETYGRYLYVVLHGIDFEADEHPFDTHDIDFFLGAELPGHGARRPAPQHREVSELCGAHDHILSEGPVALMHRIVDSMVDHYRPEVDELEERLDEIEKQVIETPTESLTGDILDGQARHLVAAARRRAAARRGRPARAARVRPDRPGDGVSLPRRLRPSGAPGRRSDHLSGSRDRHPRRAPGERLESAGRRLEGAGRDRRDLRPADRDHRPVRHERGAADVSRRAAQYQFWWITGIMVLSTRRPVHLVPQTAGCRWAASPGCPTTSRIRSPPAKSSSVRPRSSRSWSRTPSTRARRASRSPSNTAARS